jgi:DNA-binding transcriptional MerR regulator
VNIALDSAPGAGPRNARVQLTGGKIEPGHAIPQRRRDRGLLGVTTKALRVYERHGLVTPVRSGAGYRAYGPTQMRRLHQVLALKSLGLSLARIGNCLDGLGDDLGPILEAQEKDLRSRADALAAALASVVAARARLAGGRSLSVDDLVTLTKDIVMTTGKPDWREALAPLFAKHFTEAEREGIMRPAPASAGRDAERDKLLAEAKALIGKDPGAPEALQLARRWRDRAVKFTGGDKAMLRKLQAVFDDALADPAISKTLPWREEIAFIKAATERLEAAGQ